LLYKICELCVCFAIWAESVFIHLCNAKEILEVVVLFSGSLSTRYTFSTVLSLNH